MRSLPLLLILPVLLAVVLVARVFAESPVDNAGTAQNTPATHLTVAQLPVKRPAKMPVIPPARKGDHCVADTDLMRREHMSLLNHQRDETVIDGIRGKPYSLVGCVDCHAQQDANGNAIRIDAEGQFCQSCHAYAAVKIDCFSCHAAKPEPDKAVGHLHSIKPFAHTLVSYYAPRASSATVLDGHEQRFLNR